MWEIASTYKNDNLELQLIPEKKMRFIHVFKGLVDKRGHIFKFLKIRGFLDYGYTISNSIAFM